MQNLECPICVEPYADDFEHTPRVLRCGHTLCTKCIGRWMKARSVQCRICNKVTSLAQPTVLELPPNYAVIQLIQSSADLKPPAPPVQTKPLCEHCQNTPASTVCVDCTPGSQVLFCAQCDANEHRRPFAPVQRHRRFPLGQVAPDPKCSTHEGKVATLFSISKNEFACPTCTTMTNWSERELFFQPIHDAVRRQRKRAEQLNQYSRDVLEQLGASERTLSKIIAELGPSLKLAKDQINTTFTEIASILRERQLNLLKRADMEVGSLCVSTILKNNLVDNRQLPGQQSLNLLL